MMKKLALVSCLCILTGSIFAAEAEAYTPKKDIKRVGKVEIDPKLPNVLLLGDSISIGYTPHVRKLLKGKANVFRPMNSKTNKPSNCGATNSGLRHLDKWLGDTKWDVIHFNWGLHDLCHRHPDSKVYGHRDKIKGKVSVPLDKYSKNIENLVSKLKKTGAKLIWANTTFIPEGEAGRKVGDDKKYNDAALIIMEKNNIPVDDLYTLTKSFEGKFSSRPGDVHFTLKGSKEIAAQVADEIKKTLKKKIEE